MEFNGVERTVRGDVHVRSVQPVLGHAHNARPVLGRAEKSLAHLSVCTVQAITVEFNGV